MFVDIFAQLVTKITVLLAIENDNREKQLIIINCTNLTARSDREIYESIFTEEIYTHGWCHSCG